MSINEKALTILIPAWGDLAVELLSLYALPGLMQAGNLPACGYEAVYVEVFTLPGDENDWPDVVLEGLRALGRGKVSVGVYKEQHAATALYRQGPGLARQRSSRVLMAPVDQIWGNGSLANMALYAQGKDVCVAAGHLRVDMEKFTELFKTFPGFSNPRLVDIALRSCPHSTVMESWCHRDRNGTWGGGMSLTEIRPGLVSLVHHLPTPWLCAFNEDDDRWFGGSPDVDAGAWDHLMPARLVQQGRYRLLGSSDLAFGVELTFSQSNAVETRTGLKFAEGYRENKEHHRLNGQVVIGLRGVLCH